jgi:hypothetical protein
MVDKTDMDAEAREILSWSTEDFASGLLTMLFLNTLSPKGVKEMTVIVNDSVLSLGQGDPLDRLQRAKNSLEAELRAKGN